MIKLGTNLEIDLKKVLDNYAKEVENGLDEAMNETAKETVEKLKVTSPKDRGKYASSWDIKKDGDFGVKSTVIYNSKYPGLTHLTEYGHAISNKFGATGRRTTAISHIEPAEKYAIKIFEEKIRKNIEEIT